MILVLTIQTNGFFIGKEFLDIPDIQLSVCMLHCMFQVTYALQGPTAQREAPHLPSAPQATTSTAQVVTISETVSPAHLDITAMAAAMFFLMDHATQVTTAPGVKTHPTRWVLTVPRATTAPWVASTPRAVCLGRTRMSLVKQSVRRVLQGISVTTL